ncbi:MAG: hypothetical protein WCO75_10915 [Planctomycetota bacterium]
MVEVVAMHECQDCGLTCMCSAADDMGLVRPSACKGCGCEARANADDYAYDECGCRGSERCWQCVQDDGVGDERDKQGYLPEFDGF